MANINANEIERQSKRVYEQTVNCSHRISQIIENLDDISNLVKSEDSNLSNEIIKLIQIYSTLDKKIYEKFRNVASIMDNYAKKSLHIDNVVTQEVKSSNSNLDTISSQLNSLNNDVPEIFDTSWE